MIVNFKCGGCKHIYDFEVGEPSMDKNYKLVFQNKPICPKCQAIDNVLLTERGQSQMTDWHLGGM
ncbi:MAG: hypothetical protein WC246_03940 [Candidatus Paceibacterota bacterium]|jgi:rubredoxin